MQLVKCFFILLLAQSVAAFEYGAVSTGTAGAGSAAIDSLDTPLMNPAGLPLLKGYIFGTSYSTTAHKDRNGSSLLVSVTDATAGTIVPASLAYFQEKSANPLDQSFLEKSFRLGIGAKTSNWFSLGAYGLYQEDHAFEQNHRQMNFGVAGLFSLGRNMGIALVGENLGRTSEALPEELRLQQRTIVGLAYNFEQSVRFRLDAISDSHNGFSKPALAGGMESYMNQWLILRLGAQRSFEQNANLYAAGIGFVGPKFALNYGYQKSSELDELTRHSVDLSIPVW